MNETKVFRMKKNIVIIPARYKSIRFPGKPLAKISDKSMIQYIYDSIKNYSFIDKIIVATDDLRIVNHCIEMDIPYALTNENHHFFLQTQLVFYTKYFVILNHRLFFHFSLFYQNLSNCLLI